MVPKIDFISDAAARCSDMLTAAGYTFQPTDDRDTIRTYTSIRHRRIRPRPRVVHKASYTVPPHLAGGEQQLLAKVVAGGDLWPHQSRKIGNVVAEDGMLNDYGIQHFHLGTSPDPKRAHLIEGTKELLFAVLKEDDFYVLGIFDHSAWSKQDLLDIIHANWPELIAPYTIKGALGLSHNYTEEEAAKLRSAGINVIQQRPDGTIHLGMGGGVTTNCRSMAATLDAIGLVQFVDNLQDEVLTMLATKLSTAPLLTNTDVRLEWRSDEPFVVTDQPAFEINLTGKLAIPPL
ncbi:MAG: hypothetical protein PHI71_01275 [Acidiphilium sp.]|jgi:hypothetical protein|nr:hypothetical protein [Acidiphilium sp.]